jgi:hypothetical protein
VAAPVASAAMATQDIALTGWGLGVEGLSATLEARGRTRLGGELVWPRSDDVLELTLAFLQLNRGQLRARVGRLESLSGLGFTAYDGVELLAALPRGVRVEAYGGRSLARGVREPRDQALRGLQDYLPERGAYLLGGAVAYQGALGAGGLRYQREIWSDRRGLVSERASLDARTARLAPLTLAGALDYDFGTGRIGKGQLQLRLPLAVAEGSDAALELTARRYLPYFELHTIWGFFSPVAYHEAELRGSWARGAAALWAAGSYRAYQDAAADAFLHAPAERGWRLAGGGQWSVAPRWSAQAQLATELIPGAFLSSADVTVRVRVHSRVALAATGTGFQQIEEFRVGDGRILGIALTGDVAVSERVRLDAGGAAYRMRDGTRSDAYDWNQLRAWSSLRVELGRDPGLARVGGER